MEPFRYRCLVKTVFCSLASADFPTATLHPLLSVSAHLIVGCDNMSNKEGSRRFRKGSMMISHITREEKGRMFIHLHLWCWPSNHSSRNLIVRHDKYERFVKLSWDITVESKREFFFCSIRLQVPLIWKKQWLNQKLNSMLSDKRYYRWPRSSQQKRAIISSIEPLLQDYMEAVYFQHFLKTQSLISMGEIN